MTSIVNQVKLKSLLLHTYIGRDRVVVAKPLGKQNIGLAIGPWSSIAYLSSINFFKQIEVATKNIVLDRAHLEIAA